MTRRSAGFVTKKPHLKSRGGCSTCKRKKVKCDEGQPSCGYCSLRILRCEYTSNSVSPSPVPTSVSDNGRSPAARILHEEADFDDTSTPMTTWLIPTVPAASGYVSTSDYELLQHYKDFAWRTLTVRDDMAMMSLQREVIPQLSLSHAHLLYALSSVAASHINAIAPSKKAEQIALVSRQRTFAEYSKVLKNITADNYESVLITSTLLLSLIPTPEPDSTDDIAYLRWMDTFLKMSEGLRVLASLRWAAGIEKLSVFQLVCRELRSLPPPPLFYSSNNNRYLHTRVAPVGTTPDFPNPPSTYYMQHSEASPVFLPPSLLELLVSLDDTNTASGPIDLDANTLYPVLHAFSPIFLSLYYYHLDHDFFVRVFVFCSFMMPEFLLLVKNREPRALVLLAWWFALASLAPRGWWIGTTIEKVVDAIGIIVTNDGDMTTMKAFGSVERIMLILQVEGSEAAARRIFDGWTDICWDDGPEKASAWEASLLADWSNVL